MVTKVIGKVDGQEVAYERSEGDKWTVIAYCTKMLLIVDPETLCVSLQPYDYPFDIMPDGYRVDAIPDRYSVEAMEGDYLVGVQPDPYYLEVIYPMHRKGCCCE